MQYGNTAERTRKQVPVDPRKFYIKGMNIICGNHANYMANSILKNRIIFVSVFIASVIMVTYVHVLPMVQVVIFSV